MAGAGSYLLVTAVRDELTQLEGLLATVRDQEQLPALWVVVDDDSSDGTAQRLAALTRGERWIHVVRLRRHPGDRTGAFRQAQVVAEALRWARELAEAEGIDYEYVGNLDADVQCPPQLFAELIGRMEGDRTLGIAGCTIRTAAPDGRSGVEMGHPDRTPRASARLWRRACLDQTGFYATPLWGAVTSLRARNRGWRTVLYADLVVHVSRPNASRDGWWAGHRRLGHDAWYVGAHPLLLATQALRISVGAPPEQALRGLALLTGYVVGAARREPRTRDPEVLAHYGGELPRRQMTALLRRFGTWRQLVRSFVR